MSGPLLRFIPNWDVISWEYDKDRPSPRAWRRRAGEDYMSIYREAEDECGTSFAALERLKPDFAIFRVAAETLISLGGVRIAYKPVKGDPEGHAHCSVEGINRARAEKLARDRPLTERLKGPGLASRPPVEEGTDEPRDFWRGTTA